MSVLKIAPEVREIPKADIYELEEKINFFLTNPNADADAFRAYRLGRGIYGQRQPNVQMIRIKLPYGRMTAEQLIRIADVADKYATEKMHTTTRQDIQIHYVKLANTPQLWADLEEKGLTVKEACGNTVRNVTGSSMAGIDPKEPFDITSYAHTLFEYFLRNPICQEMGRKFKVSFSSSVTDTAFSLMHDVGFIPVIKEGKRGFKVAIGGGLGAQPALGHYVYDFLPENEIIPFTEVCIRVFDRYGERTSRGKARMKFLINKIGLEAFLELVEKEKTAVINKKVEINENLVPAAQPVEKIFANEEPINVAQYEQWLKTNLLEQKQAGYKAVAIRLQIGNILNETARKLAAIVQEGLAADDIRVTVNQGLLLRFVKEENLVALFNRLYPIGLATPGFNSTADITSCPGTDTCNLGIASSYGVTKELERVISDEFPDLIYNNDIKIKISGCMNACGQHSAANIGFQGMTIKSGVYVMPALQILLGGGFDGDGVYSIADKVVKVPSKKAPDAFRALLQDYDENSSEGEYFNNYYRRQVEADKMYFFTLLKDFTELPEEVPADFFIDWGNNEEYVRAIGVGECAGVILDLVGTLIEEAKDKYVKGTKSMDKGDWQTSIYHSYNTFIVGAKALLVGAGVKCNTQIGIIEDFDKTFVSTGDLSLDGQTFEDQITKLNKNEPSLAFAKQYQKEAKAFIDKVVATRAEQIANAEKVS